MSVRVLRFAGALRVKGRKITSSFLDEEWRAIDKEKQKVERPIERASLDLFNRQRDEAVQAIINMGSSRDLDDIARLAVEGIFDITKWLSETVNNIDPLIWEAIKKGFRDGSFRVTSDDIEFDTNNPRVQDALDLIVDSVKNVPRTTLDRIRETVDEGLRNRDTYRQMADRVGQEFDDMKRHRSETIALTTATPAYESGQLESWKELDVPYKGGLSQRDGRVRQNGFDHNEFDLQSQPLDEPFVISGERMMYPGDRSLGASLGNRIHCRCSMIPQNSIPENATSP